MVRWVSLRPPRELLFEDGANGAWEFDSLTSGCGWCGETLLNMCSTLILPVPAASRHLGLSSMPIPMPTAIRPLLCDCSSKSVSDWGVLYSVTYALRFISLRKVGDCDWFKTGVNLLASDCVSSCRLDLLFVKNAFLFPTSPPYGEVELFFALFNHSFTVSSACCSDLKSCLKSPTDEWLSFFSRGSVFPGSFLLFAILEVSSFGVLTKACRHCYGVYLP